MKNRIDKKQALKLLHQASLLELGQMADAVRWKLHPSREVTFVNDRNINYTNICVSGCKFCAFSRRPRHREAYTLSHEQIFEKIEELIDKDGTQILIQGGMNPALRLKWFEELFRAIKTRYTIHIHGLSPPEIDFLAKNERMSVNRVLQRLIAAGLDSIPGGGAEILSDRVRQKLSPKKVDTRGWLKVMEEAHKLGLRTSATMMFGSIDKDEDIIEHLDHIRKLQDKTEGFIAFIPWSFQPKNTRLPNIQPASGIRYLRVLAVSRIFLDNVPNIQASWVTQGPKIGQIALFFGANDFGSTMLEENVVRAAGAEFRISRNEAIRIIKSAGFLPAQRNQAYQIFRWFR
jgi:cyclic dehypoxanthinyl futalosine synthase